MIKNGFYIHVPWGDFDVERIRKVDAHSWGGTQVENPSNDGALSEMLDRQILFFDAQKPIPIGYLGDEVRDGGDAIREGLVNVNNVSVEWHELKTRS